jgi:dienelactone hydrolase
MWLFAIRLAVATLHAASSAWGQERPRLEVPLDTILVDEPFHVRVSGLGPRQSVTMRLRLVAPRAGWETGTWVSHATYRADPAGRLDLATAEALSGSYTGVQPMGLVWAAIRDTGRLAADALRPELERIDLALETAGGTTATATVWRRKTAAGVRASTVADSGLVGSFRLPPRAGPHPGVLVLGGSECGLATAEHRAGLLASRGYAALALAYCAWPDTGGRMPLTMERLARGVMEVPLEYVETGLRWLAGRPEVDPTRIGLWGTSKGAELALLVAAANPTPRAVVAVVPSSVAWQGLTSPWRRGPSWTRGGNPVPFVPYSSDSTRMQRLAHPREPALVHMYLASLDDSVAVRGAAIPVERIGAAVLLISGDDDTLWPSSVMADMIERRIRERGSSTPVVHLRNASAGHAIAPPYYPTTEVARRLGGTPLGNALAQEQSWRQALEFLEQHLKQGKKWQDVRQ